LTVGIDIREWQPGRRTGIGRFLEGFLRAGTFRRPKDRFLLIGDTTCEVRVQGQNVKVVRIPERWTVWWDQVMLLYALKRGGADVFYSPYIKVPLFAGVPVVSTIHDLTFFVEDRFNDRPFDLWVNPPFRLFCFLVIRRAAAVLVDSHTSARDVQRLLGAHQDKLRVIPLASSPAFRPHSDPMADVEVWTSYGLKKGYVLYVGGFKPHKNVPTLVRAFAGLSKVLRARHPLVLVGGPLPTHLEGFIKNSEVRDDIKAVGLVADDDMPALYRGADLFAFPSHYEGFGLPVLEAMACGTPVVCSSTPALLELAGDAAIFCDPDDPGAWVVALHELLEDPVRQQMLASRGTKRAGQYSLERMTDAILAVLDEVVRGCKRAR
jgi:glycosyltransferase involved in cell wall biosynthesis